MESKINAAGNFLINDLEQSRIDPNKIVLAFVTADTSKEWFNPIRNLSTIQDFNMPIKVTLPVKNLKKLSELPEVKFVKVIEDTDNSNNSQTRSNSVENKKSPEVVVSKPNSTTPIVEGKTNFNKTTLILGVLLVAVIIFKR